MWKTDFGAVPMILMSFLDAYNWLTEWENHPIL